MFQDKDDPSRASPRETCSGWGSYQTPMDDSNSQSCWDGVINESAIRPPRTRAGYPAQSGRTQTLVQRFRAIQVVSRGGQQLPHACLPPVRESPRSFLSQLPSKCLSSSLSLLIAEALEMIFMVAKHSNAAIAEMVSACPSWQCFAAHCTVICQISSWPHCCATRWSTALP